MVMQRSPCQHPAMLNPLPEKTLLLQKVHLWHRALLLWLTARLYNFCCMYCNSLLVHSTGQTMMLLQIDQELSNPASISSVTLSNDGKLMAVSLEGRVYLLDALEGHVQARFDNGLSLTAGPALEASFSPDSRYLISGKAPQDSPAGL